MADGPGHRIGLAESRYRGRHLAATREAQRLTDRLRAGTCKAHRRSESFDKLRTGVLATGAVLIGTTCASRATIRRPSSRAGDEDARLPAAPVAVVPDDL